MSTPPLLAKSVLPLATRGPNSRHLRVSLPDKTNKVRIVDLPASIGRTCLLVWRRTRSEDMFEHIDNDLIPITWSSLLYFPIYPMILYTAAMCYPESRAWWVCGACRGEQSLHLLKAAASHLTGLLHLHRVTLPLSVHCEGLVPGSLENASRTANGLLGRPQAHDWPF